MLIVSIFKALLWKGRAKVMVKVTMTFSTKKANNSAVLEARTLRWDVGLYQ